MDRGEKHIIRILFKNKIFYSDAQAFEDLFTKIMTYRYPKFRAVKPQGALGDKKNDGYIIDAGVYYQVYGPEDISKSINTAIKKVKEDFNGLFEKWQDKVEIKEFCYIVNDKYKGAQVTVHEKLMELSKVLNELMDEKNITVNLMVAKDLENMMFELKEDEIIDVIGGLPPTNINVIDIDFQALNEVITHISNIPARHFVDDYYVPDFEEKIKINELSVILKRRLESASISVSDMELYFKNEGNFLREDLRNKFKELYELSKTEISETEEYFSDRRYMYILDKCMPKERTNAIQYAADCLMAYYFESCDIFESPNKEE